MENKSNKSTINWNAFKRFLEESSLTVLALGFILSGLVGGAALQGHIHVGADIQRGLGGAIMAYVLVATSVGVHFAVKYLTRKA